jgi:hypothetical protein
MPLRDHFRPPVWNRSSWEGFHGGWPMTMVLKLAPLLPHDFTAEPRVHLGSYYEIDVCAFQDNEPKSSPFFSGEDSGGLATATCAPPQPTFTAEADLDEQYEYEVRVYDQSRGRLLAAIEIVSENRRAFVTKCAALLQQGVCVSLVDLVTARHFNLYADLLANQDRPDPAFASNLPAIYASTCRYRKVGQASLIESWAYPVQVGQALPAIPIWLSDDFNVLLDLEGSYEEACRALRIP